MARNCSARLHAYNFIKQQGALGVQLGGPGKKKGASRQILKLFLGGDGGDSRGPENKEPGIFS